MHTINPELTYLN